MSEPAFVRPGRSRRLAGYLVPVLIMLSVAPLAAADGTAGFSLFDRSGDENMVVPEEGALPAGDASVTIGPIEPRERRTAGLQRIASDGAALFTAPLRMDRRDLFHLSLAVAAVAATHAADDSLREVARDSGGAGGERFARAIRPLGQEAGWALLGAAYLSGRAFGKERWVAVARDGFEASLFAGGFAAPISKAAFGRSRPRSDLGSEEFDESGDSFFSGEVTQAFAMAAVIAAHNDNRWVDAAAWGAAGLIGWERMRLDAHWASDVVAGAIVGTAIGRWVVHRNGSRGAEPRRWNLHPAAARDASGGSEGIGLGFDVSFE